MCFSPELLLVQTSTLMWTIGIRAARTDLSIEAANERVVAA